MLGKIALEEHFAIPDTIGDSQVYARDSVWPDLRRRLLDFEGERLDQMDAHGVQLSILSLNSPAVQARPDPAEARDLARRANDLLAEQCRRHPLRFAGFAALPMQDPEAAARELERCVRELGFLGALVNGFSQTGSADQVIYYDDPAYGVFWATVDALRVPFYLHPRDPLLSREPIYADHPWLCGPYWAFAVETAIHALRLMASGLFDRHPALQLILGHLGEGLTFNIGRLDHILTKDRRGMPAKRPLGDYLQANCYLTTSGHFRTRALLNAIAEVGSARLLYSVDYPFEKHSDAAGWFDRAEISENDRRSIGSENARTLFGLDRGRLPADPSLIEAAV